MPIWNDEDEAEFEQREVAALRAGNPQLEADMTAVVDRLKGKFIEKRGEAPEWMATRGLVDAALTVQEWDARRHVAHTTCLHCGAQVPYGPDPARERAVWLRAFRAGLKRGARLFTGPK